MQVSIETTSGVERRMTVGIPKERLQPEFENRLKSLARQTKVKGFRPGKVPIRVVEQRFGQKVRDELLSEVVQSSFNEAIVQEKLRPVGNPTFNVNSDIENFEQGLSYTATFEIYPEMTTLHVDDLSIEKYVAEITEADIDTLLHRLQQQRQTWKEVDRSAIQDDRVIIDFVGTINGQPFKDNEFNQVSVLIGQDNFILPGFEQKLMGVSKGEKREFDLNFPPEHSNPELAGQKVHFVVQILTVSEPQIPEIDEKFIKSFGVEDGQLETLRIETRRNMERELKYVIEGQVKQQILNALLKANPIEEIPPSLVAEESQRLLKMRQQEWQHQPLQVDMFKDEAQRRIKIGILVWELVRKYQIQVSSDKVRQLIERIAATSENPEAVIQEYYADKQRYQEIESIVLEDEIVAWLLKRSKITEKRTDFYTAVQGSNPIVPQQVING